MTALSDALAAALLREYGDRDEVTDELIPDQYDQQDSADAILSDPAFREALDRRARREREGVLRMTPEDLAAIRARDAENRLLRLGPDADPDLGEWMGYAVRDRRALLAEVDRLTGVVEAWETALSLIMKPLLDEMDWYGKWNVVEGLRR